MTLEQHTDSYGAPPRDTESNEQNKAQGKMGFIQKNWVLGTEAQHCWTIVFRTMKNQQMAHKDSILGKVL
jgi:hypothetical protein